MAEHTMKIKAVLDTSDVQAKLNQMNQQRSTISGSSGGGVTSELNHAVANLNRTIASMSRQLQTLNSSVSKARTQAPVGVNVRGASSGMPLLLGGASLFQPGKDGSYGLRQAIQIQRAQALQVANMQKWAMEGMRSGVGTHWANMYSMAALHGRVPSTVAPSGLLQDALAYRTAAGLGKQPSGMAGGKTLGRMALGFGLSDALSMLGRTSNSANDTSNWISKIGGGVATGAIGGAAIGAAGMGIGAIPGAIAGAAIGLFKGLAEISIELREESEKNAETVAQNQQKIADAWKKARAQYKDTLQEAKFRDEQMTMTQLLDMGSKYIGSEKDRLEAQRAAQYEALKKYEAQLKPYAEGRDKSEESLKRSMDIQEKIAVLNAELKQTETLLGMIAKHAEKNILEDQRRLQIAEQARLKDVSEHKARQIAMDDVDVANKRQWTAETVQRMSETSSLDVLMKDMNRWQELLEGYQGERQSALAWMTGAHERGDQSAFEKAERAYNLQTGNVEFAIQMKNILAGGIQSLFEEMMTYQGLQIGDFGQLAALGGFGSTSVLGDPMLDINREQNRILQDILRAVKDQNMTAKYL